MSNTFISKIIKDNSNLRNAVYAIISMLQNSIFRFSQRRYSMTFTAIFFNFTNITRRIRRVGNLSIMEQTKQERIFPLTIMLLKVRTSFQHLSSNNEWTCLLLHMNHSSRNFSYIFHRINSSWKSCLLQDMS